MTTIDAPTLPVGWGKPGNFPQVPKDDYFALDAASKSRLSIIADKSPLHLNHVMEHGQAETDAMTIGDATHAAVFEPERFAEEYVVGGQCEAILKSGERAGLNCGADALSFADDWRCGKHGGERSTTGPTLIRQSKADEIAGMVKAVKADPLALNLIQSPGWTELSLVWEDANTGELCKSRIDRLVRLKDFKAAPNAAPWSGYAVVDLKTTENASQKGYRDFVRDMIRRHYHVQAAMYLCGVMHAMGAEPDAVRFFYVAVEKSPPHALCVYEIRRSLLNAGWQLFQQLLTTYAECKKTGVWPGYSDGVVPIEKPEWVETVEDAE